MAANNTNYYPDGYVVIPRKDYEEMIRQMANAGISASEPKRISPAAQVADEKHGKILALRNAGWSVDEIAREMGISRCTVYNHFKKG